MCDYLDTADKFIDSLVESLQHESKVYAEREVQLNEAPLEELVATGKAVQGLKLTGTTKYYDFTTAEFHDHHARERAFIQLLLQEGPRTPHRFLPGNHVRLVREDGSVIGRECELIARNSDAGEWWIKADSELEPADKVVLRESSFEGHALISAHYERMDKMVKKQVHGALCSCPSSLTSSKSRYPLDKIDRAMTLEKNRLNYNFETAAEDLIHRVLQVQPGVRAIQGPPGTGKTDLLAIMAGILAGLGCRVLVTASNHEAIHVALIKVRQLFPLVSRPNVTLGKFGAMAQAESLPPEDMFQILRGHGGKTQWEEFRTNVRIVGATMNTVLGVHWNSLCPFDVVLVDEAGQMPLYLGALTRLMSESVALFGDDAQLPAIMDPDNPAEAAKSLFQHVRTVYSKYKTELPSLTKTYRLCGTICDIVADHNYDGNLSPATEEVALRRLTIPANTSLADPIAEVLSPEYPAVRVELNHRDSARCNLQEAELAASLISSCINPPPSGLGLAPEDVICITPYRDQRVEIVQRVEQKLNPTLSSRIVVDTVERVQGHDCEVAIFSLATSSPGMIEERGAFLYMPNRLNVAISRARSKVIIIASSELQANRPNDVAINKLADKFWAMLSDKRLHTINLSTVQ